MNVLTRALVGGSLIFAASCQREGPRPFGEALVVVDADWPSTAELDRLRVDLYAQDGRWFSTRDVPSLAAGPVSFSVYSDDDAREKFVWVRLRAYPSGRLRDTSARGVPRLVEDGVDVTPDAEPDAALTVDRLLVVRLRPGERRALPVVLHAACTGRAATLREGDATAGPIAAQATTCVDEANDRAPVVEAATAEWEAAIAPQPRTWGVDPCPPAAPSDERVCVAGGPMLLGTSDLVVVRGVDPTPERLVVVSHFYMDRDEVSVGRYRAALASGLPPPDLPLGNNPGPLGTDSHNQTVVACTWSTTPLDREGYALNCVGSAAARAFCMYSGGDLPTEAQWEYAASVAGRPHKTSYVWGDEPPACARAIYGREGQTSDRGTGQCLGLGAGPRPLSEYPDVTPFGVRGLAGGLTEWTRDAGVSYRAPCWASAPMHDPSCIEAKPDGLVVRGAAWDADAAYLRTTARFTAAIDRRSAILGFRCIYREAR